MANVLVVEDDKELNELISTYLKDNGYDVTSYLDAMAALKEFDKKEFDIILSDIMMPIIDGFSFAEKIRAKNSTVPIVFMTARDDKPSKQLGYKIGIDDYITKPFDIDELVMKVGAILRRSKVTQSKTLTVGNLKLDKDEHTAYIDGKEVPFTVREFDILYKILSYPKKTFTRSQLMEEFWDYDSSATSRTVDVYMAKLREKTNGCAFEIVTVHGLGYKVVLK